MEKRRPIGHTIDSLVLIKRVRCIYKNWDAPERSGIRGHIKIKDIMLGGIEAWP
ncbi:MAG: hypothetical protein JRN32_03910 [Nitrososphaerota archaeon]|jgi:hypothetical protein|nr:hypothetical protein [Nitrososphaerota archaeon]MDG7038953.1 hypothetical protein [Nitrososphaerota archaeon]MDG7043604.1 hypothetical protein [Nitrososphaerota archaeon]MDG7045947.1 hypothetical protein [Nitrososphaerota archaeon]